MSTDREVDSEDWYKLAEKVSQEQDNQKFTQIVEELCEALGKKEPGSEKLDKA